MNENDNIMKVRLKNWITSIFGGLLMALAITLFILTKLGTVDFSMWELVAIAVLGWVFLWAKDTLIEGLFLGMFKVKEK